MTPSPESLHRSALRPPAEVPSRAAGLQLLGEMAGSGYRRPPLLVRRGDGQTVQITPLLYAVLEVIDGRRDHAELAEVVSDRVARLLTADDIRFLVESKLGPLGVLRGPDGAEPVTVKASPLLGLRFRATITNPRVTRRLAAPFAWLFHPGVAVPVTLAFALASWWTLFHKGLGTALDKALYQPRLILVLVGLTVLSAAFHELGHAAACRRGGGTPGAMGAALYLVWPVFYTDVTDSYRLGRAGRLRVDLGGLYFNGIFTLGTVGVWAVVRADALLLMVPIQLLQMIRQLIPLVRFDGYHILADLVGVPDLFARIKPILLAMLPGRQATTDPNPLKPWARVVVSGWVVVVVPFLVVTLGWVVWTLPQVAVSAWDSLGLQAAALRISVTDRNLDRIALGLVAIVAVALLPASMAYLVTRILRVTTVRMWIATEGHPAPRGLAMLVAVALLATAGSQWWPERETEPIQQARPGPPSDERSASDGQFVALQVPAEATLVSALAETGRAATVAPPSASPTVDQGPAVRRPAPGIELQGEAKVPAEDDPPARPTWPFPFDPPPGPGAGDNHALAVNTTDGTSVVDSSFSLQWLSGGSLDQANRAYALASCVDCRTVAVAFQALIATGATNPVVPENLAVAVNSECATCVTRGIAVQLAVTLERSPSDDAKGEIAMWWSRLGALKADFEHLSPDEIHTRLVVIRAAILEILAPYGEALPLQSAIDSAGESPDDAFGGAQGASPGEESSPDTPLPSVSDDLSARGTLSEEPVADVEPADGELSAEEPAILGEPVEEKPVLAEPVVNEAPEAPVVPQAPADLQEKVVDEVPVDDGQPVSEAAAAEGAPVLAEDPSVSETPATGKA